MCCRGLHRIANPAYLSRFLFCGLLCVAPYCVPGGVRVVSTEASLLHAPARLWYASEVRLAPGEARPDRTLDRYNYRMSSMSRHASHRMVEALNFSGLHLYCVRREHRD